MAKPALVRGMRDFSPAEFRQREYLFDTIKGVFRKYGFEPIETPVMETLEVLEEKYGEEGNKLLFRVLNSGQYLEDVPDDDLLKKNYLRIGKAITEKGLRYDLTVPLARFVAMNRNDLPFPFKRFQIDKVWRADRPQKGRYREFYQCDADVIGSSSMLYDAECILMFDEVFYKLKIPGIRIHVNNRKILQGLAEAAGFSDRFGAFAIAIDKWDKIGENGVVAELGSKGFSETEIHRMQELFRLSGSFDALRGMESILAKSDVGMKGIKELRELKRYLDETNLKSSTIILDLKLARGLDYYTSTIFEVTSEGSGTGSIAAGGRYDELTASFGLPDMPGVGISFGAERLYDIMRDQKLFPDDAQTNPVKALAANFGGDAELASFQLCRFLRDYGIACEMYPSSAKLAKQFTYAEKKRIPNIILLGSNEVQSGQIPVKNLQTGVQQSFSREELISYLEKAQ